MLNPRKTPPPIITDNDRFLVCYAWLDDSVGYTKGHGLFFVDAKEIGRVPCLAICEDKQSGKPTLYYCDENWTLLGVAANYQSVEAAKDRAERIYPGSASRWIDTHFSEADTTRYLAATAALISAARLGDVPALKTALASGAALHGTDARGWCALSHAAHQGRVDILRLLVDAGALDEESFYALYLAASGGHFEAVRILVEAGTRLTRDQRAELLRSVAAKDVETGAIRKLLESCVPDHPKFQ